MKKKRLPKPVEQLIAVGVMVMVFVFNMTITTADTTEQEPAETPVDVQIVYEPKECVETWETRYAHLIDEDTVNALARVVWGEARGLPGTTTKAAVVWSVINLAEDTGLSIRDMATYPGIYCNYSPDNPVEEEYAELAKDVLARYFAEKDGAENVGRVLPKEYRWFCGNLREVGCFRNKYEAPYDLWDWSLDSPYKN